jgi:hypothetical protein
MKKIEKIGLAIITSIILLSTIYSVKTEMSTSENVEIFLERETPGLRIIVSAIKETQPNKNITIILNIVPLVSKIYVEHFNFSVFGFVNGTHKTLMPLHPNITDENPLSLPYAQNFTCQISDNVWGITLGEIEINYNVTSTLTYSPIGKITIEQPYKFKIAFDMTYVENIYLEELNKIFRDYLDKNLTPENLNEILQEYKQLKETQNESTNIRMVVGILIVTTVFFIATTLYLVLRKPNKYW